MEIAVPPEFLWVRAGRRIALVHRALDRTLGRLLLTAPAGPPAGATALAGGRGGTYRMTLDGGDVVVLRLGRRGGILGPVLRDLYWGSPPRPFVELVTTAEARQRGVPGPEPLGARVDHMWGGWYRGIVVTRHLRETETLWRCLQEASDARRRQNLSRAAGRAVRALCEAGVYHPDLNLNNCVVRQTGDAVEAFIVDFDRAQLADPASGAGFRDQMLQRLERSARKLDPGGTVVTADELEALRAASGATP